jgi:uncharacterized protein YkwD
LRGGLGEGGISMSTVGMNVRAVVIVAVGVLALGSGILPAQRGSRARYAAPAEDFTRPVALTSTEQEIFVRTNDYRCQNGLPRCSLNPQLTRAARYFAHYMSITGTFDHDADGKGPGFRAAKFGYNWALVCENIAYRYTCDVSTQSLPDDFVVGWIQSAGHRKNMLCDEVVETGIGVAVGRDPRHQYSVQVFGRPRGKLWTFSVVNDSRTTVRYVLGHQIFTLRPGHTRVHPDSETYPSYFESLEKTAAPIPMAKRTEGAAKTYHIVLDRQGISSVLTSPP